MGTAIGEEERDWRGRQGGRSLEGVTVAYNDSLQSVNQEGGSGQGPLRGGTPS